MKIWMCKGVFKFFHNHIPYFINARNMIALIANINNAIFKQKFSPFGKVFYKIDI